MAFKRIGFIVTVATLSAISCADLPKTSDPRFVGEPSYIYDEYENLDDATRKETEYRADSIIRKFNTKFAEDCSPYSDGQNPNPKQNRHRRINCVTFR